MRKNPEPEILVPPDMENFEVDEEPTSIGFPYKRLLIMVSMTLVLILVTVMGLNVYIETQKIGEVIPYLVFSVLLLTPTACSYYFFFSFFTPRLRNPYEWDQ